MTNPKKQPPKVAWLTKEQYEEMKADLEARGFVVLSKYRKNMTSIKLGDIVLSENK